MRPRLQTLTPKNKAVEENNMVYAGTQGRRGEGRTQTTPSTVGEKENRKPALALRVRVTLAEDEQPSPKVPIGSNRPGQGGAPGAGESPSCGLSALPHLAGEGSAQQGKPEVWIWDIYIGLRRGSSFRKCPIRKILLAAIHMSPARETS